MVLSHFFGNIAAAIGIVQFPRLDVLYGAYSDRKEPLKSIPLLQVHCKHHFSAHPLAVHTMRREHQQKFFISIDSPINLLHDSGTASYTAWCIPDFKSVTLHALDKVAHKRVVFAAVANEARIKLHSLSASSAFGEKLDLVIGKSTPL